MSLFKALPRATAPAALGSLVSLAAQGFLALVLFKLFSPEAVGVFSVTSQIAFFWGSLALAQSPLSLLANRHEEPFAAARQAWWQSVRRMLWLAPLAAVGAAWAGLGHWGAVWAWAAALCLTQLSWQLAQSLTLRVGSRWAMGGVRMVPPVLAALAVVLGAWCFHDAGASVLLGSAVLGYVAGAWWLRPAWQAGAVTQGGTQHASGGDESAAPQSDPRSARLKMLHALVDGLAATALAVSWPAHYGAQEAGWLLAVLRILSFIPALVHTAWAQVVLGSATAVRLSPVHVAWSASVLVLGVGALAQMALALGWLDVRWQGLSGYVWPLAAWQIAACFAAAYAHWPFQKGLASVYSRLCIVIQGGFVVLCVGLPWLSDVTASQHINVVAAYMGLSLCGLTLFVVRSAARCPR
ncbi:hypothetical protein [Limnohabitans sp. 2KL-1]|jgi:hypothetical protein|uniref:hypothetical protein n=1 Tax=Limnohabitans sp. 2KL-1 TaxID=1100699 RepID=UPI000D3DA178|nr:hypothetical protein [Limnohabitans sp. 2KL-1]